MKPHKPRSTDERDEWIGGRIRLARKALGMSQSALSDKLGVTFQQVQKYERGSNRVAVTRLCEIARILEKPIDFFLPLAAEYQTTGDQLLTPLRNIAPSDAAQILTILDNASAKTRNNLIELIESMDKTKA